MKALLRNFLLYISLAGASVVASNQLAGHPSPYLEMHSTDPVAWHSWQVGVFEQARAGNRLVFVSVGYFSCHWCHVMHRESYQDPAIAEILNRSFISVKVDRELEPDLDRRLIEFVASVRGAAGWPLNVFLTPEGYPVTGFTYLPPHEFTRVLQQLDQQWQLNHARLSGAARNFFETQQRNLDDQALVLPDTPAAQLANAFLAQAMQAADELQGGFGNTRKFPNVPQLDTLLDLVRLDPALDPEIADFVMLSLHTMATRNLHDPINGGFFRYTIDPDWQTPHFEKMLYDNAQLARLYLKAHRQWPTQGFSEIATRTLDFIEASLKHPAGGYMSSLSAVDLDDKEGGAYFWTHAQLASLLDAADLEYLAGLWQLPSGAGEFLGKPLGGQNVAGDLARNQRILRKLQVRGSASMPVDDKRLASWNAMMLEALVAAADLAPRFAKRARAQFATLRDRFYRDGSLLRLADNAAAADAVLEDYAQVARAFFKFGRKFEHADATRFARLLAERAHALFLKQDRWQQKAAPLIPIAEGKWIIPDGVLFSPMTLWLEVALELTDLDSAVRSSAGAMLQRSSRDLLDAPYFYSSFIMLRLKRAKPVTIQVEG